jgi:hypothetical protein
MGLEALAEVILENENFQLIEEITTIIFTTREIALGTVGDFNFHRRQERDEYIQKKIERLFKTFSHDISNSLYESIIAGSHINLVDLTSSTAAEFLQSLKAVMERQPIYVEAPVSESTKMKNDLVRLINSKLGDNDKLKEEVRKAVMMFHCCYFAETDIHLNRGKMIQKYICERNTELYRRQ